MNATISAILLGLAAVAFSCAGRAECTGVSASYSSIQTKVVTPQCIGCHADMNSHSGLTAYVVSGDSARSSLFQKLDDGDMPKNSKQLCETDIANIGAWIVAGAPNN